MSVMWKSSKTIKALLEASKHIENLCAMNQEYGLMHMESFQKILAEAVEEIEANTRKYVGGMKNE